MDRKTFKIINHIFACTLYQILYCIIVVILVGCGPSENSVKKMTDQDKLVSIAYTAKKLNVRIAAIKKITSQNKLAEIAITKADDPLCSAIMDELSDQNVVANIILRTNSNSLRQSALWRLTELEGIEISVEDNRIGSTFIRFLPEFSSVPEEHRQRLMAAFMPIFEMLCNQDMIEMVGPLTSLKFNWSLIEQRYYSGFAEGETISCSFKLLKIPKELSVRWSTGFPHIISEPARHEFGEKIGFIPSDVDLPWFVIKCFGSLPQNFLVEIASKIRIPSVQNNIYSIIHDQAYLRQIVVGGINKDPSIQKIAIANLTDQKILKNIVLLNKDSSMREVAVKNIKDINFLKKIALYDKDLSIRKVAVENIYNQKILEEIALQENDFSIRQAAIERLTNKKTLERIALEDKDPLAREAAVEKITNPNLLKSIADADKDANVRAAATVKLIEVRAVMRLMEIKRNS